MQTLRAPFDMVAVIYGHEHLIQHNQSGNISFHSAMATAWPWPYPSTCTRVETWLPRLTVEMNRAAPFFEREATGWPFINMHTGNVDMNYVLPDNTSRVVVFDTLAGKPVDTRYQDVANRIPPLTHFCDWEDTHETHSQVHSCSPGAGSAVCRVGPGR